MSEKRSHEEGAPTTASADTASNAESRPRPLDLTKPPREWRRAPRPETAPHASGGAERTPTPRGHTESLERDPLLASRSATSPSSEARPAPSAAREEAIALPGAYGIDRLVLLVRDPYWSYCWWELTPARLEAARHDLGEKGSLVLRFYDISFIDWDGQNHHTFFDIEVQDLASNWYVELGRPGASFVAEIGLRGMTGRFVSMVRSNTVELPRDRMSSRVDEEWLVSEERYQRLFELSGGAEIGLGSAEILRALEERLRRELAEAGVSSFGISSLASRREP